MNTRRNEFKELASHVASLLGAELKLSVGDDGPDDSIFATFSRGAARVRSSYTPSTNEVWFDRTGYGRGKGGRYTKVERLEENVSKRLKQAEDRAKSQAEYFSCREKEGRAQDRVNAWIANVCDEGLPQGASISGCLHTTSNSEGQAYQVIMRYRRGAFDMRALVGFCADTVHGFFTLAIRTDAQLNPDDEGNLRS